MAIGQPFNQQFKGGDVAYGISQARAPYLNSLPPGTLNHLRAQGQYVICDEFNNRTFGKVGAVDTAANWHYPSNKAAIKSNLTGHKNAAYAHLNPIQHASVNHYYDALKKSKYAPLNAVKMNISEVIAKGNQNMEDLVFRRACKGGLKYVIELKKGTVHFVLDVPGYMGVPGNRIDSLDVVLKTQHAGHVPITTSELRTCYRNRANWMASGRLKFYFNLLEVQAPWVTDPHIWAIYEAHRIKKGVI